MKSPANSSVAVLGLGIIGSRARARMVAAGWQVKCWNRTPRGLPGETATPEDAACGVGLIAIYLKDGPAVRAIMERLSPTLLPGQTLLNHSTVDLATTLWLADECARVGCGFLDVPFTGSKLAAENGQLVYYTGGSHALLEEVEPLLRATCRELVPCGGIGTATVVKLVTNLISACTVQALAEALALATSHGVSAECLTRAVAGNFCGSPLAAFKLPCMAGGDFDTHFSLDNMRKDSRYALDLARSVGMEVPAIEAVSERMTELCDRGLGGLDYCAVAKAYQPGSQSRA
jgi:3-hydroxyisobutyrate dehydrogenase/glyoxylate/succinic semialdehyde reductase